MSISSPAKAEKNFNETIILWSLELGDMVLHTFETFVDMSINRLGTMADLAIKVRSSYNSHF